MPNTGADQSEVRGTGRSRVAGAAGWLGPWLALAALALWTATSGALPLAVAAVGVAMGVLWRPAARGVASSVSLVLIVVAVVTGLIGQRRADTITTDFEAYWSTRDSVVGRLLNEQLNRRYEAGDSATSALIDAWLESPDVDVSVVRQLRDRWGPSALALYDPFGRLVVWDGVHRGRVPETVQAGVQQYSYHEFPLFGYFYYTALGADGSTAVAAFLLRSTLPEGLGADLNDFASDFYEATGERIRITGEDPGPGEGPVWDLEDPRSGVRILSVVVDRPDPVQRADQVVALWAAGVSVLLLAAWLLLALARPRRVATAAVAAGSLVLFVAWLPLDRLAVLSMLFEPDGFRLAGPMSVSLGRFALVGAALFALVGVLPRPRAALPPWGAGMAVALAFPVLLGWAAGAEVSSALAGPRLEWVAYEVAAAALLSLFAAWALSLAEPRTGRAILVPLAVLAAVSLAAGGAAWVWRTTDHPLWWVSLWGVPGVLAAVGASAWTGWRRSVAVWGLGVVLGSTAAIPVAWSHRVQARVAVGEERLAELAAFSLPSLETSLLRFAALTDSLDRAGREGVTLLYTGWRLSGLSESGHPVLLQVHRREGTLEAQLGVGWSREPPPLNQALLDAWSEGGTELRHLNRDDARYILTAALEDGGVVAVVAPPFIASADRSGVGPLLRGVSGAEVDPLSVIPLRPGDPHQTGGIEWIRTADGWLGEMVVTFANEGEARYHAHYLVTLPGVAQAVARATLLLAINLALFLGFWLIGQALAHDVVRGDLSLSRFVISFRARVTLALFGFFTLANALFGTVAYRTLNEASQRSARVMAERLAEDAAGWYPALGGQMELLSSQVGAELLEYTDGELAEGSVEELVELGLYEGWTPYRVYQVVMSREVVSDFTETSLGRWEYVTAYRPLPDGGILAVQVPLEAGTSALQTSDLLELLVFLVLVGAGMSLALAMLAGRALTRPISALQSASERVGAGDLGIRLPEDRVDEFGSVFRAFNRMVGRVRRARGRLRRTSRRTQLIMDEAAVGMVALDAKGHVTLANPRAEELLGGRIVVGEAIPGESALGEALAPWLASFLEDTDGAADSEFQTGERRVRVRVRRLGSLGNERGVVVAMDDVTDELRAERVLAWGEMARQVAHEVKNPLTPIKLSVQHVRRAWEDRHPDFEEILLRNANAMLSEIERLAGIAQSFSRFGAPAESPEPLAPVAVAEVVDDVMALYGPTPATVRFEQDVEPGLPPVIARSAELKEVLINLLENARLAGGEGTRVSVGARRGGAGAVVLTVVDDGAGIAEDVLPRIFEPQFSTRSTGTGLGLAIVQRLVTAWGGHVTVKSRIGEGTEVEVVLREWTEASEDEPGSSTPETAS